MAHNFKNRTLPGKVILFTSEENTHKIEDTTECCSALLPPQFLVQEHGKFNGEQSPHSKKPAGEAHKGRNTGVWPFRTRGWESSRASTPGSVLYLRDGTPARSASQCPGSLRGLATAFCIPLWSFRTLCGKKNLEASSGGETITLKGPGIKCYFNSQQQQQKRENNEYNFCVAINPTLESQLNN